MAAEGARLIGVDLSRVKLDRLTAETHGNPISLVQADACRLPFPDACLDAILTVRVLHLIAEPEMALHEFRRLLKPDGVYVRLEEVTDGGSIRMHLRTRWQELLEKSGLEQHHGGRSGASVDALLQGMGARAMAHQLPRTLRRATIGVEIERIRARVQDGSWRVPAELLPGLLAELRAWAEAEYGPLERASSYGERAILHVWRF